MVGQSIYLLRFAAKVKKLRNAAGLSQEALAKRAELNRTHINLIETGKREPRLLTIFAIATALGVEPGELMPGGNKKPRK